MPEIIAHVTLTQMVCPKCSGVYALSNHFIAEAQLRGNFAQQWACPYCKQERGCGESEVTRLNAKLAELEKQKLRVEEQRVDAEREAEHFRKSRDTVKGLYNREKKRVANGVCPCCNRSFVNLKRHMATKHPKHGQTPDEN